MPSDTIERKLNPRLLGRDISPRADGKNHFGKETKTQRRLMCRQKLRGLQVLKQMKENAHIIKQAILSLNNHYLLMPRGETKEQSIINLLFSEMKFAYFLHDK